MSKIEWTDEQIAERRQEWSYEINDEMLTDEQIMALPYHYEPHTHEEELGDYADALLARQRLERQLGKLASYAVHQPTCTAVLSMTNHCSCGLHAALREGEDGHL